MELPLIIFQLKNLKWFFHKLPPTPFLDILVTTSLTLPALKNLDKNTQQSFMRMERQRTMSLSGLEIPIKTKPPKSSLQET